MAPIQYAAHECINPYIITNPICYSWIKCDNTASSSWLEDSPYNSVHKAAKDHITSSLCTTISNTQTAPDNFYRLWKENYYGDEGSHSANVVTFTATTGIVWPSYVTTLTPPLPVSERFRQILRSRQIPMLLLSTRSPIKTATEERELRARETLRRLLGDGKFQRFLRNGFVSVQGKSGKVYQIYPGHGMTVVYNRGTPIEKLCVVLRGDFTPVDSLITRYVMILHDEQQFRALANVWQASPRSARTGLVIDTRPLPQILQSLKVAA